LRCPYAVRIWAERIAVSLLRMGLGEKLRRSFRVSTGFGHLSSQVKSILACSWGCCLAFSSTGSGRRRLKRLATSSSVRLFCCDDRQQLLLRGLGLVPRSWRPASAASGRDERLLWCGVDDVVAGIRLQRLVELNHLAAARS